MDLEWPYDNTPGCYMNTIRELQAQNISLEELLKRCLVHFGSAEQRVRHAADDDVAADAMGYRALGRSGDLAYAIKACEREPWASTFTSEDLMPLFLACIAGHTTHIDSLLSSNPNIAREDVDRLMDSHLFRQAIFFAAIVANNAVLAVQIVEYRPLVAPPVTSSRWIIENYQLALVESPGRPGALTIPLSVWPSLVRNRWTKLTEGLLIHCALNEDSANCIDLLNAFLQIDASFIFSRPDYKEMLCRLALRHGMPELVQHYWELFDLPLKQVTDEMLIHALDHRASGGEKMIQWLLENGADINYMQVLPPNEAVYSGGPRSHGAWRVASDRPSLRRQKTALHTAAWNGNVDAVTYLLLNGAKADSRDGLGDTARDIAEKCGHKAVVQIFDAQGPPKL